MTILFTILILIASVAMILVVLVQKSKGGGLASGFSSTNSILGVKKTTDTVEKVTWILASIMIVLSIATVSLTPKAGHNIAVDAPNAPEQTAPDMSSDIPTLPEAPAQGN